MNKQTIYPPSVHFTEAEAEALPKAESVTGIKPAGPLVAFPYLTCSPFLCFGFSLHPSPWGLSSSSEKVK